MECRKITDQFSVAAQIHPVDLPDIANQGFRSIICNRPEGESPDQSDYAAIAGAAKQNGLEICYIPIIPGMLDDDLVSAFSLALQEMPKPILAYCRSGTRSTSLWSLTQAGVMPISEIMSKAAAAGYDLSGLQSLIEERAVSSKA